MAQPRTRTASRIPTASGRKPLPSTTDKSPAAPVKHSACAEPKMTLTVEEMAYHLGIGRNLAYELTQRSDFPAFYIGHRLVINRQGLQAWMDRQTMPPAEDPELA